MYLSRDTVLSMLDYDRIKRLGDYLSLFKPKGRKSGGSRAGGSRKAAKVRPKTVSKKSGGSKKKTIKARKSKGQKATRRQQRKVSPSRSKK